MSTIQYRLLLEGHSDNAEVFGLIENKGQTIFHSCHFSSGAPAVGNHSGANGVNITRNSATKRSMVREN